MSRPRQPPGPSADAQLLDGLVVGSHGRHCVVETPAGERVICHPRGKKLAVVVGDGVRWRPSHDEGTVEQITPRRNLLYRQDTVRTKSFAANLDQVLILVAAEPEFSEHQLARALIACEAAHIEPLIVLNKADLAEPFARAWQRLAPYRAMGYAVLPLAVKPRGPAPAQADTLAALGQRLHGRTTLILGPSGAGKSTLINRLIPGAAAQTGEISQALNSGKHTTTTTTWYWLDAERRGAVLDSPGFQEFGLRQLQAAELAALMPDLAAELGQCRFHNCTHREEPQCALRAAVEAGRISASRWRIYQELYAELSQTRW